MTAMELIGQVATDYIWSILPDDSAQDSVARFLLDRLTGEQVSVICRNILEQNNLTSWIKIKVPRELVASFDLPDEVLTDEKTTYWRNAECDKPAILMANTNNDQGQSLKEITTIGARDLKSKPEIWIAAVAKELALTKEQQDYWQKALKGLQEANDVSLERFGAYVVQTRNVILEEGIPLVNALGWALPALRLPRDSAYFTSIPEKALNHTHRWRKMYADAYRTRGCYLYKQTPNSQGIDSAQLAEKFAQVKEQIRPDFHTTIDDYIRSSDVNSEAVQSFSELEWERDKIHLLFTDLRTLKLDLGTKTKQFFDDEYPDVLEEQESAYLETLSKRKIKEPVDDDRDFYDKYRLELETDKKLKMEWEKFIYGRPVECTDFLVGLLGAVERLFNQSESTKTPKALTVSTTKSAGKKSWLQLNEDVGLYFCIAYKGLPDLFSRDVTWNTHWLFKYDDLVKSEEAKPKYKRNTSVARAATEIDFHVQLSYVDSAGIPQKNDVKVVWKYAPATIGLELAKDLQRLSERPFAHCRAHQNPISKKGKLQNLSLSDVGTLEAVFGQDRGSLVGPSHRSEDLHKIVDSAMFQALKAHRISNDGYNALKAAWEEFRTVYRQAINDWLSDGISAESLIRQSSAYETLLNVLRTHANQDVNRTAIWHPIMQVGIIDVTGERLSSIVAPWHPLRMAAKAIKARQVSQVINYVLKTGDVDFGDSKLFFSEISLAMEHPYYPEVTVGFAGQEARLLSTSDTVNDYSLMEYPILTEKERETNEDPREATEKIIGIIKKYLELQPHERTNLSVALFNIDSSRLPQSIVNGIASMHDGEEEVRCQVILRHDNMRKLSDLYMKMIESVDQSSDLMMASEVSRDFMARLRIGVMADAAPLSSSKDGKPVDIVYMQDIISKEAKVLWVPVKGTMVPELINYYPPRWSRIRPARDGDLKSTVYLVAPGQPSVGWSYLKALRLLVDHNESNPDEFALPARQISFQNERTVKLLDEAHALGEWVMNYDELIEPRLLRNQGLKIIKYQHNRSQGRNIVVSSSSQLNLLKVLINRKLAALNLSISSAELFRLTELFVDHANTISGDIILRAARRGAFASELLGVVLSKNLIQADFDADQPVAWFFLDDYAMWLGQKEEQIADILALSPQYHEKQPFLKVIVTEAKYVDSKNIAEAKKVSEKQLRDTALRMNKAIFGNPSRLDRDLWLSRLTDMLNDRLESSSNMSFDIEKWRDNVRAGTIPIELKGYSHVFASTGEVAIESTQKKITNVEDCFQEVYARSDIQRLVLALLHGTSLTEIRKNIGDATPWLDWSGRFPAKRMDFSTGEMPTKNDMITDGPLVSTHVAMDIKSGVQTTGSTETHAQVVEADQSWASPELWRWICLNGTPEKSSEAQEGWAVQTVNVLKNALISYNLQSKVLGHRLTPNAVVVRLKGSDQLKMEDIEKKRSQLLTTHAIDVINVSGQPGEIVVSITRPERQTISLADIWKKRRVQMSGAGMNTSFVLGLKEMDGEILYLNLGSPFEDLAQHGPHTLIAGSTGSGKSVLIQNLILDICATNSKGSAQIYLIDPKFGVDYQLLEDLPNLVDGIIVERENAVSKLEFLVDEMDRRYLLFRSMRVNNLADYNSKVEDKDRLPMLFLIHDEFAEWMLIDAYKSAVSSLVQRLGVKSRAAGIYLIFAAQRPEAAVLPPQLRDNLANRLILKVESIGTSEIALGEKGAEKLLGNGHLAARLQGQTGLIYAQVSFMSNRQIEEVAKILEYEKNVVR